MFDSNLLRPEVQQYLRENYKKDLPGLILKASPFPEIRVQELALQLKGLKVAEKKFPLFFDTRNIIYPAKLNLEQTSSQITAEYKAELISGNSGIDLTGGLGIDTYFISRNFRQFDYCELNEELAEVARHNFKQLGVENVRVNHADGLKVVAKAAIKYDWVYADPARRDDSGGKVFRLEDCEPNIPANLEEIFNKTNNILLKTSPILDITAGINELGPVREVHIVSVKNEVKELLWILENQFEGSVTIRTLNFEKKNLQKFSSQLEASGHQAEYSLPLKFLYEPNAAIMKSGLFDQLAHFSGTNKLNPNSHLYTSETLVDFPGRRFEVADVKPFKSSHLKKRLKSKKANVTIRNFPESVENLRKKYKIRDGGEHYVFFTTNLNEEKIVIFCKKA